MERRLIKTLLNEYRKICWQAQNNLIECKRIK
jgi:hypothetical protein